METARAQDAIATGSSADVVPQDRRMEHARTNATSWNGNPGVIEGCAGFWVRMATWIHEEERSGKNIHRVDEITKGGSSVVLPVDHGATSKFSKSASKKYEETCKTVKTCFYA